MFYYSTQDIRSNMLDEVYLSPSWGWIYEGGSIIASGAIGRNNQTIALVRNGRGGNRAVVYFFYWSEQVKKI